MQAAAAAVGAAVGATAGDGGALEGADAASNIGDPGAAAAAARVGDVPVPLLSFDLPVVGNLGLCEMLPSAEELGELLLKAQSVAAALAAQLPHVTNLDKLARRIRSDLEFVQRCCTHRYGGSNDAVSQGITTSTAAITAATASGGGGNDNIGGDRLLELTPERVQGIINNLRGFQGELLAAQTAPGLVGVLRRFQARVVLPSEATVVAAPPSDPAAAATAATSIRKGEVAVAVAATGANALSALAGAIATATAATAIGGVDRVSAVAAAAGQKRPLADKEGDEDGCPLPGAGDALAAITTPCHPGGDGDGGSSCSGGNGRSDDNRRIGNAASAAAAADKESAGGAIGRGGGGGAAKGRGGGGGGGSNAGNVSVEVDVVAQMGHCWIEVKNQETFGLESVHWAGARHIKGLRRQVEELLAVAAAPEHHRRWQPPRVVLFFPSGVHPDVRQQLEARGAYVAVGPGRHRDRRVHLVPHMVPRPRRLPAHPSAPAPAPHRYQLGRHHYVRVGFGDQSRGRDRPGSGAVGSADCALEGLPGC
ncbi:hypothetical protein Vretimale_16210 [Volvox reticuliferus]|uniref:DUF1308 domain-containing protein n=1 Tax=Volvox reticuliferus TaxID=1737510 RepID=A0A8J4GSE6_9CHLO|nr:hypothetical protein Vretimale_16210 [Volvox reticuliferus]